MDFFKNKDFSNYPPVQLKCGLVKDVQLFVSVNLLRVDLANGKESEAAKERLNELKDKLCQSQSNNDQ